MPNNFFPITITTLLTCMAVALPTSAQPNLSATTLDASDLKDEPSSKSQPDSISQGFVKQNTPFSDLESDSWATESVYSLMERYNCLEGFPDGTFRGDESMTRYQFVAGMNACLTNLDAMIQGQMANLVDREDLAMLFKLLSSIFEQAPDQMDNVSPAFPSDLLEQDSSTPQAPLPNEQEESSESSPLSEDDSVVPQ